MSPINTFLDRVRDSVRSVINVIAVILNKVTFGKLSPDAVTITSLLAHFPIAWLLSQGYFGYSAILLIIFGLFDALDGALARLQDKSSAAGMLLDASTDRMKEVLLYIGASYALIDRGEQYFATWAVAACGGSLLVSYVKAKGETAVKDSNLSANEVNRLFQDGLMRFEIRMFTLVIGLALNQLAIVMVIIAVMAWLTAIDRLIKIKTKLK